MLYCICAQMQTCVHIQIYAITVLSLPLSDGFTSSWVISMQVESLRENKTTGMKTAPSLWEKQSYTVRRCSSITMATVKRAWSVGSQNLKVTQSIHVLIIPLPYERNITSLVSMMKIHIRSFQPVYFSSEHKELAIRVKTRKWTAYLLINQTQVHYFRVLHGNTIFDFV